MNILNFFKPKNKSAEKTGPSDDTRRVILQCMAAMAAADGNIGEEEVTEIDAIYTRLTGQEVGVNSIAQIVGPFLTERVTIGGLLEHEHEDLSDSDKALVLKASYLVLMADGVSAEQESTKLNEITSGLRLSDEQAQTILAEVK